MAFYRVGFVCAALVPVALMTAGRAATMPAATERFAPPAVCEALENKSLLKVDRGMLLCFRRWTEASDTRPNLYVFDRTGRQVAARRVYFDGAMKVEINDAAAAPGGAIVVAGMAAATSGQMAGFVSRVAADGSMRTTQMRDTIPNGVCVADDRTAWALVSPAPGAPEGGGRLVHMAADVGELGAFLPRARFHSAGEPALQANEGRPGLFCGASGVNVYVAASGDWFEVGGDGGVVRAAVVPKVPFVWTSQNPHVLHWAQIYGYAAAGNGVVYAGFQDERGPVLYQLDPGTLTWREQAGPVTPQGRTFARLAGSDGNEIVYEVCYRDGSLRTLAWGAAEGPVSAGL